MNNFVRQLLRTCGMMVAVTWLGHACTTAIITGKATKDGRPIIWKQRDTGNLENKLVYHQGEQYRYLGVHDLRDSAEAEVFMGSNEVGFCIINTQSYNLVYAPYDGKMDQEGFLMKRALATCRTVDEFERLLDETRGKRGVEANFGVLDASGGAAYFETDPYAYTKFDVTDPSVAPNGYLIRTNFSVSGAPEKGSGYTRYETTMELFSEAALEHALSVGFILNAATTNLKHSLTHIDLSRAPLPRDARQNTMVPFIDYVPRYSTASSLITQGVGEGEDPAMTTMWVVLGNPLTTPVIPVWVSEARKAPAMMFSHEGAAAPLNSLSLRLKERCFPVMVSEGRNYIDLSQVLNQDGTGTLQMLLRTNAITLEQTGPFLDRMRRARVDARSCEDLYKGIEAGIREYYRSFQIE